MQINSKPLVSTLICTYNAENFLDATLLSVVEQSYHNQEILIRDDGSRDNTVQLLKKRQKIDVRITLFIEPWKKRGPYWWLNYLLDQSKWEYIAIQDHDDLRHPSKLEKQVHFLENTKEYDACWSAYIILMEKFWKVTKYNHIWSTYKKRIVHHTSLMYRTTEKRYETLLERYVDLDFMQNKLSSIYEFKEVFMLHRERSDWNNLFSKRSSWFLAWLKLISYNITFFRLLYYLYRSIVWEYLVRWLSIHIFHPNQYYDIEYTTESRVHKYLLLSNPEFYERN